jgi:hypothetical protein
LQGADLDPLIPQPQHLETVAVLTHAVDDHHIVLIRSPCADVPGLRTIVFGHTFL